MGADMLAQAFASTAGVLAGVESQQLDGATPCASWRVRELINHVVASATFAAVTAETGEAPEGGETPDFCAGDFVTEFNRGAARAAPRLNSVTKSPAQKSVVSASAPPAGATPVSAVTAK